MRTIKKLVNRFLLIIFLFGALISGVIFTSIYTLAR